MEINGTALKIVRGDSGSFTASFKRKISEGPPIVYEAAPFVPGDTVRFTVRDGLDGELLFQTVVTAFTDGKAIIAIKPDDTKGKDVKEYCYDIEYTSAAGEVLTFVEFAKFTLKKDAS